MKHLILSYFIVLLMAIVFTSCKENVIGGPCKYDIFNGTAEITEVVNNIDSIGFKFTFTPDFSFGYKESYWDTGQYVDLSPCNPDSIWFADNNIETGAIHLARSHQISQGGCIPYFYDITDIQHCGN